MSYFTQLLSQHAHTLRLPRQFEDDVQSHVRMHQSASAETAPFGRQLDFWAFSIATALAQELPPRKTPSSEWGRRFIDTRSVRISDDLCDLLAVVAFHHRASEEEGFNDPASIVEMANRLAGAGCPAVLQQLTNPDLRSTALEKILDFAGFLYGNVATSSEP